MAPSLSPLTRFIAAVIALGVLAIPITENYSRLHAQKQPAAEANKKQPAANANNKADESAKNDTQATQRPQIPDKVRLAILVQSYMVALSQANLTGNYSILHAFGAPEFQQRNSPEKLSQIFSHLQKQNVDLTPIILYSPTLVREPAFDDNGMLHLTGYYKTEPQQVHFELILQPVAGVWRLYSISVKTAPASAGGSPNAAAPSAKATAPIAPKEQSSTAKKKAKRR